MAARKNHKDSEKYLVDHGADVNMKDGVNGQDFFLVHQALIVWTLWGGRYDNYLMEFQMVLA